MSYSSLRSLSSSRPDKQILRQKESAGWVFWVRLAVSLLSDQIIVDLCRMRLIKARDTNQVRETKP